MVAITLSLVGTKLEERIGRLALLGHEPRRLLAPLGAALVQTTHDRFRRGEGPDGAKWKPLLPAYAAIRPARPILMLSLRLFDSINFQVEGNAVRVGSNVIYARVHQFGAVIRPRTAKALRFRLGAITVGPRGGKKKSSFLVFAHAVTVPARPYLGFGERDFAAVEEIVEDTLKRLLDPSSGAL